MADIFATFAPAYWSRNIPVIPLMAGQKRPAVEAWQMYSDAMPAAETRAKWLREHADGNLGLALGAQSGICMLDVDTDDPKVHALVDSLLPASPWRRYGRKGFALAFRWSGHRTFRIRAADGGTIMELLSSKTQIVLPPSIHPDTRQPYHANGDLLAVHDDLPTLPKEVEIILREGLKELGFELSATGCTRLTEWVAPGARDNKMIQVAGMYARAILKGEVSVLDAMAQMRGWHEARVEKVAGDDIDIDKGVQRMIEFLITDVVSKGKPLPAGWDAGLTEAMKTQLGLDVLTDEFQELTADQIKDALDDALAPLPLGDARRSEEVDKTLVRIARQRLNPMTEEHILRWIADSSGSNVCYSTMRARVRELRRGEITGADHTEIAAQVLADLQRYGRMKFAYGKFWMWNGSHWVRKDNEDILNHIADNYGSLPAARKANDHQGIMKIMSNKVMLPLVEVALPGINFANGYLTQSGELVPHNPAFGATYCLPYRCLPELADQCPQWIAFLMDRWAGDADRDQKTLALQEAMCATLLGFAPRLQRAILLVGVARSGKSRILNIMRGLLPEEAVCNVAPNDWSDKFAPSGFVGKLLNVAGELSESKFIQGDVFKQIIEGETIRAQYKNKDAFDLRPLCAHWFGSNHLPRTRDTSEGFNRRWLILNFNHAVPVDQVQLDFDTKLLADEREAITAWAIQAMPRLLTQNGYTLPPSHEQSAEDMAEANDSVRFFMNRKGTGVLRLSSGPISSRQFLSEYSAFCTMEGVARPVSSQNFHIRMINLQNNYGFRAFSTKAPDGNTQVWYENTIPVTNTKAA